MNKNKELEALNKIFNGMYNKLDFFKEFKTIEKALTPSTAYEVCKALGAWLNEAPVNLWNYKVYHDNDGFYYYNNEDYKIYLVKFEQIYKTITSSVFLPPHLITLVGRFYEGVKDE